MFSFSARWYSIYVFYSIQISRLYAAGALPAVSKLYRPLSYPVGRGTPMLNSKIGWDHSQRFIVPKFGMDCKLLFKIRYN